MVRKVPKKRSLLSNYSAKRVGLMAAVVLVIGGLLYFGVFHKSGSSAGVTQTTSPSSKKVNLSPATASDKQSNDANKEAIVNREDKLNSPSQPTSNGASIIITDVDANAVRAYVQGIFEDGGSCTAAATQKSETITASSQGFGNVSNTQCAPLNWQTSLGPGEWSINVTYKSSTTQISAVKNIRL